MPLTLPRARTKSSQLFRECELFVRTRRGPRRSLCGPVEIPEVNGAQSIARRSPKLAQHTRGTESIISIIAVFVFSLSEEPGSDVLHEQLPAGAVP